MDLFQTTQDNRTDTLPRNRKEGDDIIDYSDEMNRLDALFCRNTPTLEVDTQKMWWEIKRRLDICPHTLTWTERFSQWINWVPASSEGIVFWQKPVAVAACLILLVFSTWIIHDQTTLIEQWQVLIQIDKAWTGKAAIDPSTEENPFVLSEDGNLGVNPFDKVTS